MQIVQILGDAVGQDKYNRPGRAEGLYEAIHGLLAREYGVFELIKGNSASNRVLRFLLYEADPEKVLDVVELGFRIVDSLADDMNYHTHVEVSVSAEDATEELNTRFREHGIGYQYASGEILRVDSALIHAEVVKPVLHLLSGDGYTGANEEFLSAHEHYRHARYEEAMTDCLKALESTLKAICAKRDWSYAETDTAKRLLEVVFTNGLIPSYLTSEFTSLRSTLESGVPTVRNKQAGHGQGVQIRQVPQHLASYVLHLTATSILFLAQAEQALPA